MCLILSNEICPGDETNTLRVKANVTRVNGESLESAHSMTGSNGNKEDSLERDASKRGLAHGFKGLLSKSTKNSRETPGREKRPNTRTLQSERANETGEEWRRGNRRTILKARMTGGNSGPVQTNGVDR